MSLATSQPSRARTNTARRFNCSVLMKLKHCLLRKVKFSTRTRNYEKALWDGMKLKDGGTRRDSYFSPKGIPTEYPFDCTSVLNQNFASHAVCEFTSIDKPLTAYLVIVEQTRRERCLCNVGILPFWY